MDFYNKIVLLLFTSLTLTVSSNVIDEVSVPSLGQEMKHSTLLLLRQTRTAEKHKPCCGSYNQTHVEEDILYANNCLHIFEDLDEEGEVQREEITLCVFKYHLCVAKQAGWVDEEGFVIVEKFVEYCQNRYQEPEIKEILKNYAPSCIKESEERARREKDIDESMGREFLNSMSTMVTACMGNTIGRACPKQHYNEVSSNVIDGISAPSLGQELKQSPLLLYRQTRNTDKYPSCCGTFNKTEDQEIRYGSKCFSAYDDYDPKSESENEDFKFCQNKYHLCIAKKAGWVDKDGFVIPDKYTEHFVNLFVEPEIKEIVKEAAPNCIKGNEEQAKREKKLAERTGSEFVNSMVVMVTKCIRSAVVMECPKEYHTKASNCKDGKFISRRH
ncbi:hypothetical protein L9F63_022434 [Diploptera punctata]|uniref:Uncharacterized protein n=1 Tax=Diploptera punctata TaxID=6984 RepID=A0AAD7ZNZ0_DIPPU|nr:hypothetical protein L9F63_022434 [Diploptera punctata]